MSSLRDFYVAGYTQDDPAVGARLGRWRALGAASKAGHVLALCGGARLPAVVEIGCGDGALLAALSERGLAEVYDGFELSPAAAALAEDRAIPLVRSIAAFDGVSVPAADGAYALAILSHVLEHVPDPAPLLAEAARVADRVLIEVPLEANRSARRPAKVAEARRIGHLHAFTRADMHRLAAGAGLRVVSELGDPLGREHHAFFARGAAARARAGAKWAVRSAAWRAFPSAAQRAFSVHYAALLARSQPGGRAGRGESGP